MNCRNIQELAPLWLSGELEHARHSAFGSHLADCAECARLLSGQASVDARILSAQANDDQGAERIRHNVLRRIKWERRRRWLLAASVAAAILLALFIGSRRPGRLYLDAARDHRLEVVEHQPRNWRSESADIEVVAQRFGFTDAQARRLAPGGYRLLHAKTCSLEGRPALHLVYTNGMRDVSVYLRRTPDGLQRRGEAEIGSEQLASVLAAGYSGMVVTVGNSRECREIARRLEALL